MAIRTMPNDIDAEKSVLGACFLSKYALQKACESLTEESFYDEKNLTIFKGLEALNESKTPLDIVTFTSYMQDNKLLNDAGGVEYVTSVVNFVPVASNIDYYIKIVNEKSMLRKLINAAEDIASEGYNTQEDVNDTLDVAERKILDIVKNRKATEFKSIQDIMKSTEANLEKLAETKGEVTGLATGWYDLDKLTAGLHENQFIIIAARPAMGKTAFALNLATNVAINSGKTVALFNLEMGAEQLANRILSSLGGIDGYKLQTGKLLNDDWKRISEAISQLEDTNMYIDDTPGITIGEIRAKCRRLASTEKGLGLVIIDYLQLISGGKNYGSNRQQEVSDISRALKTLAMELHIPIIALAQLSRQVEQREDKRPLMSDLRESGSIEQDADIVSFLYRDDYYNKEARNDENSSITELIIAKHRNGPTATIQLLFKKNSSTFLNIRKEAHPVENQK